MFLVAGAVPVQASVPLDHLVRAYETSQILMIGIPNHSNKTPYLYLKQLLAKIGTDPHLKIIALERQIDTQPLYDELLRSQVPVDESSAEIETDRMAAVYPDRAFLRETVCSSPERAFTIRQFLPEVRRINRQRAASNAIRVVPVDGMRADRDRLWPGAGKPMTDHCGHRSAASSTQYVESFNREQDTLKNFKDQVLSQLGPSDKAIVVYHYGHMIRTFQSCAPGYVVSPNQWETRVVPTGWGAILDQENPSFRMKSHLVVFDEGERMNPYVNFRVTEELRKRRVGEAWAHMVPELRELGLTLGSGIDVFERSAQMLAVYTESLASNAELDQMIDSIVHIPNVENENAIGPAAQYYPVLCAYR